MVINYFIKQVNPPLERNDENFRERRQELILSTELDKLQTARPYMILFVIDFPSGLDSLLCLGRCTNGKGD